MFEEVLIVSHFIGVNSTLYFIHKRLVEKDNSLCSSLLYQLCDTFDGFVRRLLF